MTEREARLEVCRGTSVFAAGHLESARRDVGNEGQEAPTAYPRGQWSLPPGWDAALMMLDRDHQDLDLVPRRQIKLFKTNGKKVDQNSALQRDEQGPLFLPHQPTGEEG